MVVGDRVVVGVCERRERVGDMIDVDRVALPDDRRPRVLPAPGTESTHVFRLKFKWL